ncbi:CarD family transcriptional regulator [Salimicrobium flavidum]|uniref:Transcriptional regulator, CarD family n=1 Tax=Salimicrobium flavidum TaxID=570947 RepID=A0A1N7J9X1_9BACI|nr:CarD family transcriptional regulator [Salimicrobium flavidum]SIS46110.1 transcriptional regulator, CarD family [Salimicrobium flavidum]
MFSIGDLLIYSTHGICRVDDICEKTFAGETKTYYVLFPLEKTPQNLKISIPTDNEIVVMLKMLNKEQAEDLLQSFEEPGVKWIDHPNQRFRKYSEIVRAGDRKNIVRVLKTFLRKKTEAELVGKKLYEQDKKLLNAAGNILFRELALALDVTMKDVEQKVVRTVTATPI